MPRACPKCARVNPAEARFCFHDGSALGPHAGRAGPAAAAFAYPFVFPSGRTCRTFDELALACHDEWGVARALLRQSDFANFFSGLGRGDLAEAARDAARAPDSDRGLDALLGALPTSAIEPAKLRVEPTQVNLGTLAVGQDARFNLHLTNQGMRLLTGTLASNSVWLALGDGEGAPSKVFQFGHEAFIPVRVRGKALRAGTRQLEGKLTLESTGGEASVIVRCDVPVRPYADSVLAGATTPRQIAEKARAYPKEAALLFENGAVAHWYALNGWTYPVQGPAASGLGAVQQFFEALGLTSPPKVEVSESAIYFIGDAGHSLQHTLRLSAQEKRPVYAHAVSDRPWLEVSRVKQGGQTASIRLAVAAVPDRPGELLVAHLTITANGNQRFVVPVTLAVNGPLRGSLTEPALVEPEAVSSVSRLPAAKALELPLDDDERPPRRRRPWLHVVPIALLILGLLGAVAHDWLLGRRAAPIFAAGSSAPLLEVRFHDREEEVELGLGGVKPGPGGGAARTSPAFWEPSMRFGLTTLGAGPRKRLTFEENGTTNNTCIRLDGNQWLFGERPFRDPDGSYRGSWPGRWLQRDEALGFDPQGQPRIGKRSKWLYDLQKVEVTQTVELVAGEQSEALDTCLVRYRLENRDALQHRIGLRFLLDTYIGGNDGVPFLIPGATRLCDTQLSLQGSEVPQYLQACETEDLANPGTIARLQMRLGGGLDPPDRVTLGAWPNPQLAARDPRCLQEKTLWDVPLLPIKSLQPPDSAVTMYWDERLFPAGAAREVGFAYGLGSVSGSEGGGQLAVTAGGSFTPGGELTVTAYVRNPSPGQTVTLQPPEGFRIVSGVAQQPVPQLPPGATSRVSPVTWKLTAGPRTGDYVLTVTSSNGATQTQRLTIKVQGIFGG